MCFLELEAAVLKVMRRMLYQWYRCLECTQSDNISDYYTSIITPCTHSLHLNFFPTNFSYYTINIAFLLYNQICNFRFVTVIANRNFWSSFAS